MDAIGSSTPPRARKSAGDPAAVDTRRDAAAGSSSGAAYGPYVDSAFDTGAFESFEGLGSQHPTRWIGWRRRALVLAALLGCLGIFSLARWVASTPAIDAAWSVDTQNRLLLRGSALPALETLRGHALVAVRGASDASDASIADSLGAPVLAVDGLLQHRAPRWQVDDGRRAAQLAQQQGLRRLLAAPTVQLQFDDGTRVAVPVAARGYTGLGLLFWPLSGLALLLYLFAMVLVLARPLASNLLFVAMTACQSTNLLLIAVETTPGLGLAAGAWTGELALRVALDLATGAAALHAFTLHPRRLPGGGGIAAAGWLLPLAWVLANAVLPELPGLWWWGQGACVTVCVGALAVTMRSYRVESNPYALVMRRFAAITLATLLLVTTAVLVTAQMPAVAASTAVGASLTWYLFLASLLLLTPSLARSRQVLREFALLAGISTVATSLDLLFVAVFSVGSFASLALAVFIALGLYAGARQWLLNHLMGSTMQTTERTFDQIYRAAREVQARPSRYPQLLGQLLRELFEPLEVLRVDRVPVRARVVGGGSALVVPVRSAEDEHTPIAAVALRFAHRGQRLFTLDDAKLADRVVDQLRRAVAYDQAVERGRAEERQRIAQDLHDDIGARLLTLMYQAQTREMEDYIRHTLQDLKTLTRGLAASEHRLSHAAAEWKADLTQRLQAAHAQLGWSFSYDDDLRLSVVQWSALTRVLRELVSNALYHGHATRIDVSFHLEATLLTLQVADDGGGSRPQDWAHGLGLGGVRKRVKLLGGKVAWRENDPGGIVCAVRVPGFTGRV